MLLFDNVSVITITAIVGIIKEFKPKMIRHITDATIPIMEVI